LQFTTSLTRNPQLYKVSIIADFAPSACLIYCRYHRIISSYLTFRQFPSQCCYWNQFRWINSEFRSSWLSIGRMFHQRWFRDWERRLSNLTNPIDKNRKVVLSVLSRENISKKCVSKLHHFIDSSVSPINSQSDSVQLKITLKPLSWFRYSSNYTLYLILVHENLLYQRPKLKLLGKTRNQHTANTLRNLTVWKNNSAWIELLQSI